MTIQEIIDFKNNIIDELWKGPENGYNNFLKKWRELDQESKAILRGLIMEYCAERYAFKGEFEPALNRWDFTNEELRIACSKIYHYLHDELNGKPNFTKLKLGKNINVKDIAAIFKLLKSTGYITNSLEEISEVILNSFNVKSNSTISKYLDNPEGLRSAALKFKKKIHLLPLKEKGE